MKTKKVQTKMNQQRDNIKKQQQQQQNQQVLSNTVFTSDN